MSIDQLADKNSGEIRAERDLIQRDYDAGNIGINRLRTYMTDAELDGANVIQRVYTSMYTAMLKHLDEAHTIALDKEGIERIGSDHE